MMKIQYYIYVFTYLLPICITLFSENERLHSIMLNIALVPAFGLFFIEIIQMKDMGLEYFAGWNIIDFS